MYSRQETAKTKQEFWTAFGQYMLPVLSSEGEKINWINYKTAEKDVYFRMQAGTKEASIGIEIKHSDPEIQQIYFEHFIQLKNIFHQFINEKWIWLLHTHDEHGKIISRIYIEKHNVSIMRKEDWPLLISFFKPRIIALDQFWSQVKYGFETLR